MRRNQMELWMTGSGPSIWLLSKPLKLLGKSWSCNSYLIFSFNSSWPGAWAEGDYPFMQNMLGMSIRLNNETLFMKAVIRNLTFDGIDSPLLHMGDDAGGMLGDMLDNQIPFDRFGWFYDVRSFCNSKLYHHCFSFRETIPKPMTVFIRCSLDWMTSTKLVRSVSGKENPTSVISTPMAARTLWAVQGSFSLRTETKRL